MSKKVKDDKNRWRSKTIAFRASPEEAEELDKRWKLCGFQTKQDYLITCMLKPYVVARGNQMMITNFRKELRGILSELERINEVSEIDEELFTPIRTMLEILESFKNEEADSRRIKK